MLKQTTTMANTEIGSPKSRRRRKVQEETGRETKHEVNNRHNVSGESYYDDSDEEKYHRPTHEGKTYGSAFSMGKLFLNPCLCLASSARFVYRRVCRRRKRGFLPTLSSTNGGDGRKGKRQKSDDWIDLALLAGAILLGLVCLYCFAPSNLFSMHYVRRRLHHGIRPTTDADVNRVEVRIAKLDFQSSHTDIGGWMFLHNFFEPTEPIFVGLPDRGGFYFLGAFGEAREIRPDDDEVFDLHWRLYHMDHKHVKESAEYSEALEDKAKDCRRPNWMHLYNPSCNDIHEISLWINYNNEKAGLGDDQVFDSFYIRYARLRFRFAGRWRLFGY
jgi:hypothetical protein